MCPNFLMSVFRMELMQSGNVQYLWESLQSFERVFVPWVRVITGTEPQKSSYCWPTKLNNGKKPFHLNEVGGKARLEVTVMGRVWGEYLWTRKEVSSSFLPYEIQGFLHELAISGGWGQASAGTCWSHALPLKLQETHKVGCECI
jgi:hypothetical protein